VREEHFLHVASTFCTFIQEYGILGHFYLCVSARNAATSSGVLVTCL
jgi:hypothetical protein